jgi:hypothetical protein
MNALQRPPSLAAPVAVRRRYTPVTLENCGRLKRVALAAAGVVRLGLKPVARCAARTCSCRGFSSNLRASSAAVLATTTLICTRRTVAHAPARSVCTPTPSGVGGGNAFGALFRTHATFDARADRATTACHTCEGCKALRTSVSVAEHAR